MPETGENVARDFGISREDQDRFALRSQQRALAAQRAGYFAEEIVGVAVAAKRGEPTWVTVDEHPRETSLEALGKLPTPFRHGGTVTAGNSSGVNDGACALLLASQGAIERFGLEPRARIVGTAVAGVEPRIMGIGPVAATRKLLDPGRLSLDDIDLIELNEAFAAQALAVLRELGIADDAAHVNRAGRRHCARPSAGRERRAARCDRGAPTRARRRPLALCTMCIGVGQGIAMLIERVASKQDREVGR